MTNDRAEFRKRHEELKKLFEEGGPRLEAYLKEQAREGISSAYMFMDEAVQELGEAIIGGHKDGLTPAEIEKLLDELVRDAELWGGRIPLTIRLDGRSVRNIVAAS